MAVTLMRQESPAAIFEEFASEPEACTISELYQEDEADALQFLAARPIHTVFMASLIRDNGLASPQNRGSFYACRDQHGQLEGVGLLGHATMIEAQSEAAISAFARLTRNCFNAHLIRGERETINQFWKLYASPEQTPRFIWREFLLEQKETLAPLEPVDDLRRATLDDLDQVLKVNAGLAFQERGINPLNLDPAGFRRRTARRIEQGRVWVWIQEERMIFKADVLAETPQATYLEGVHIHPEERMKGYGMRCLTELSSILFARTESICLTVDQRNKRALAFYAKAGYQFRSEYETFYFQ